MQSEAEIAIIQKAAMYDLIEILETNSEKHYTAEELKKSFAHIFPEQKNNRIWRKTSWIIRHSTNKN